MDESIIQVFGSTVRGDYLLLFATVIMGTLLALVQILSSSRKNQGKSELEALLSKPEILELIKAEKTTIAEIVDSATKESVSRKNSMNSLISKIANDIEWDIAGIIGVGVTVVLLFMVVSGTVSKVPEPIFTGWLLILGYYFGKGGKAK